MTLTTLETYLSVIASRLQDGRIDKETAVDELGIAIKMTKELQNGSIHNTWNTDRTDSRCGRAVCGSDISRQTSAEEEAEDDKDVL